MGAAAEPRKITDGSQGQLHQAAASTVEKGSMLVRSLPELARHDSRTSAQWRGSGRLMNVGPMLEIGHCAACEFAPILPACHAQTMTPARLAVGAAPPPHTRKQLALAG
jgi:hypothetical protein